MAPGRYYVSAEEQTWNRVVGDREFNPIEKDTGEKAYAKIYFPASLDLGKASTVTVKEGEEIPAVDILMKEVVAYRIRGKVTNLLSKTRGARNVRKRVKLGIWWTRGDSNPRPPRCERGKI